MSVQSRSELVQAECVSIEEDLVITGSVCQYRTGTKDLKNLCCNREFTSV